MDDEIRHLEEVSKEEERITMKQKFFNGKSARCSQLGGHTQAQRKGKGETCGAEE